MSVREIITLQIGHYANFVGTHWWNIQESSFCYDPTKGNEIQINHDVLFREGLNPLGEVTYTPRLISVDLKGSLRTLKQEGTLYSTQSSARPYVPWSGNIDVYKTEPARKNEYLQDLDKLEQSHHSKTDVKYSYDEDRDICLDDRSSRLSTLNSPVVTSPSIEDRFYDLDNKVKVWSDFLRIHYHPKTVVTLEDYFHDNEQEPFDIFGDGIEAYNTESTRENIEETCRKFAEECNFLQGFQILQNGYDGFAGLSSKVLNFLDDEYSSKIKLSFPLFQPVYQGKSDTSRASEVHRLLTSIFCIDSLSGCSSMFTPMNVGQGTIGDDQEPTSFPYLNYNKNLPYHTSAILAMALESLTSPLRLKLEPTSMNDLVKQLTPCGRKLISASVCLPFPWHQGEFLSDILSQRQIDSILTPLSPHSGLSEESIVQSIVMSGFPNSHIYGQKTALGQRLSVEELIAKNLNISVQSRSCYIKMLAQPCKTINPFPSIFNKEVNVDGSINGYQRSKLNGVKQVPVLSSLHNSNASSNLINHFVTLAAKTNFKKFHRCFESGIETDDIEEVVNNLKSFGENYEESAFKQ